MRTFVLLIDLQRAFCDADGSLARQGLDITGLKQAAMHCSVMAARARARGVPVGWTRMVLAPDYADGGMVVRLRPNLARIGGLRAGTPDVAFSDSVSPQPGDVIIDKPRYSALYATSLEAQLRARRTQRVLVGGVTTSMCVESTVRDLAQRDHEVVVIEDACADFDASRHQASLQAMRFGFAQVAGIGALEDLLSDSESTQV